MRLAEESMRHVLHGHHDTHSEPPRRVSRAPADADPVVVEPALHGVTSTLDHYYYGGSSSGATWAATAELRRLGALREWANADAQRKDVDEVLRRFSSRRGAGNVNAPHGSSSGAPPDAELSRKRFSTLRPQFFPAVRKELQDTVIVWNNKVAAAMQRLGGSATRGGADQELEIIAVLDVAKASSDEELAAALEAGAVDPGDLWAQPMAGDHDAPLPGAAIAPLRLPLASLTATPPPSPPSGNAGGEISPPRESPPRPPQVLPPSLALTAEVAALIYSSAPT